MFTSTVAAVLSDISDLSELTILTLLTSYLPLSANVFDTATTMLSNNLLYPSGAFVSSIVILSCVVSSIFISFISIIPSLFVVNV